ncbi:putative myosin light chain kinase 3 [Saguinus oedipus]|uniref:Myosin light chain kinase 3 n=1 Tax=Saguinus oedipus TaxID=9490 RepID=A0ABQ9TJE4_SAGOE|nr:putative myosin light chain kinase 3 [Saguinus oedipus]
MDTPGEMLVTRRGSPGPTLATEALAAAQPGRQGPPGARHCLQAPGTESREQTPEGARELSLLQKSSNPGGAKAEEEQRAGPEPGMGPSLARRDDSDHATGALDIQQDKGPGVGNPEPGEDCAARAPGRAEAVRRMPPDAEAGSMVLDDSPAPPAPFEHRVVSVKETSISVGYEVCQHKVLGGGRFGQVHRCTEKSTGLPLAAKIIKVKSTKDREDVKNEINIMNQLSHVNLIQLYDAFESKHNCTLVMEYVDGGELFDRITDEKYHLTELDVVLFTRQICEGVHYLHQHYILHLDLKKKGSELTASLRVHIAPSDHLSPWTSDYKVGCLEKKGWQDWLQALFTHESSLQASCTSCSRVGSQGNLRNLLCDFGASTSLWGTTCGCSREEIIAEAVSQLGEGLRRTYCVSIRQDIKLRSLTSGWPEAAGVGEEQVPEKRLPPRPIPATPATLLLFHWMGSAVLALRLYKPREKLKVNFGTPEFLAPEVVNYEFVSFPTDMWSVGVITYMLLSGLSPFLGETDAETMNFIVNCSWDFDADTFEGLSEEAKDFVSRLLVKEKSCRMSATQCLKHEWLNNLPAKASRSKVRLKSQLLLQKYIAQRKWKGHVIQYYLLQYKEFLEFPFAQIEVGRWRRYPAAAALKLLSFLCKANPCWELRVSVLASLGLLQVGQLKNGHQKTAVGNCPLMRQ